MPGRTSRDDDSLSAAQVDIDGAKERIKQLEEIINSPDKMGGHFANAVAASSVLRTTLSSAMLDLMNDHDTRKELVKILGKVDRESFWRWGKYVAGFLLWAATIVGAIFAYIAIKG